MLEKKYILDKISEDQYQKFRDEFLREKKVLTSQFEKSVEP